MTPRLLPVWFVRELGKHAFDWLVGATRAWLRWFWRLGAGGKLAATFAQTIVLYIGVEQLPLAISSRRFLEEGGALGLAGLLLAGLLFSGFSGGRG